MTIISQEDKDILDSIAREFREESKERNSAGVIAVLEQIYGEYPIQGYIDDHPPKQEPKESFSWDAHKRFGGC